VLGVLVPDERGVRLWFKVVGLGGIDNSGFNSECEGVLVIVTLGIR
jgi:hypothetical protein